MNIQLLIYNKHVLTWITNINITNKRFSKTRSILFFGGLNVCGQDRSRASHLKSESRVRWWIAVLRRRFIYCLENNWIHFLLLWIWIRTRIFQKGLFNCIYGKRIFYDKWNIILFLSIVIKAMFTDDIKNYMENMHIMILYIQTKDDILCQVPTKLTRYNNSDV